MALGTVDDPHLGELDAAFRLEMMNAVLVLDRLRLLGPGCRAARKESERAKCRKDETPERRW
jgi:hypothetical protein